ncbi:hypothetical protein HK100_000282 [Physocladia obscura]|uniref:Phosphatidylinositol-3,4,5-trisphosphate 3-phosphatase n=1 Tax=Physocladia obscura TaxID=109957 RepID=A0AAD5SYK1_9FUNG|nr:hypothetical protein HK100_000282 [Physocladia obscura]
MSVLKRIVSQGKQRTVDVQLDVDLDLTYLTSNLIAMGFPARDFPMRIYRNSMAQTVKFLDAKHNNSYKVYNLCSEAGFIYPQECFYGRVAQFPFDDHSPPPFALLLSIVQDMHAWISSNPEKNIVVVHCKAGKGRTGVVCCAYLLAHYAAQFWDAQSVFEGYTRLRMLEGEGLTVASQCRWVEYFAEFTRLHRDFGSITGNIVYLGNGGGKLRWIWDSDGGGRGSESPYSIVKRRVSMISIGGAKWVGNGEIRTTDLVIQIWYNDAIVWTSTGIASNALETDGLATVIFPLISGELIVGGDICVKVRLSVLGTSKRLQLCQYWFNTFFVQNDREECKNFAFTDEFEPI